MKLMLSVAILHAMHKYLLSVWQSQWLKRKQCLGDLCKVVLIMTVFECQFRFAEIDNLVFTKLCFDWFMS